MAALRLSTHSVSRKRVLGAALFGAALVVTVAGVRARLDSGDALPVADAPVTALVPLYVLPEQPAARVAATFVAPPEHHYAAWELSLMHGAHSER